MTPPIDPDTLAKLRAHIAAAALATVAAGGSACKQTPTHEPAPNNPMPHTVNEPAPNTPAQLPTPSAQELANLPSGRAATQDPNEPANLPDGATAASASGDGGSHSSGTVNEPAQLQPQAQPTPPPPQPTVNLPAPRRAPPGNG
jgi:hypothetical protein